MLESHATSSRFHYMLLGMLLALLGACAWFTYTAVHTTNENTQSLINSYSKPPTTNYKQCVATGNAEIQTSPEVCATKAGQRFVNK